MTRRLKILLSAYACSPRRGSEHGVGWGWSTAIARHHDVWVLTSSDCRAEIEEEMARRPELQASLHFVYVKDYPCKRFVVWFHRYYPPLLLFLYRHYWQRQAFRAGLSLHQKIGFDLAHNVTFVGFRCPGYLWQLDLPFVWGPVGGLENTPWHLLPLLGPRGALYYGARNIVNGLHRRFRADSRRAFRRTQAIIAATQNNARLIGRYYGRESQVICEIGTPVGPVDAYSVRRSDEPMRISWSGQHIGAKALPLLLQALARLPEEVRWRLEIVGHGPLTARWRALALRLGIHDRCTWWGWLPRGEAMSLVRATHVFVITSLKDLTSTVLLEALAQGVPVICLDHCGFADVVDQDCGIKIPIDRAAGIEGGIAHAIDALWRDELLRQRLAQGALRKAEAYRWEKKMNLLNEIYVRVVPAADPTAARSPAAPGAQAYSLAHGSP